MLALGFAGCGWTDEDDCTTIAAEYAAALPQARVCDPLAPDPCGAARPVPVYEQSGSGPPTLDGLCQARGNNVNPARTAPLDGILDRYAAASCPILRCPGSLPYDASCRQDDGGSVSCR
jgi:hypothetical protein